ncbi:AAA family ATPase [Arthrobacter sp. AG1021]|uniref:AAA family ATPase n=1 Tax=Arthrobacter sp. AG1021 TaxID=2183908 RepID=UPI0011C47BF2|nr:AAA family ATPase [Arthrobacter sp. AG1021]
MATYHVHEIFTPTSKASLNYVERQDLHDQMYDALMTPGTQIIVFGESGAGKSTLLRRKLADFSKGSITTFCTKDSTYESILFAAFDELNALEISESFDSGDSQVVASISADAVLVKSALEATEKTSSSTKETRLLPPQLTPQRLAKMLSQRQYIWVLEDFHKVSDEVKTSIAQILKVFCDVADISGDVRVVLLGAVESAYQVVKFDPEMEDRVCEIEVPVLTDQELSEIITQGSKLLKVDMSEIKESIVDHSSGLAKVCHQLALTACRNAGVYQTMEQEVSVTPEHLHMAIKRYVNSSSDTLREKFDRAVDRKRVRKFDNGTIILGALCAGEKSGLNHAELMESITKDFPDYPSSNLTTYLNRMLDSDDPIIRRVGQSKYRFSNPFLRSYAQFRILGSVQLDRELQDLFKSIED